MMQTRRERPEGGGGGSVAIVSSGQLHGGRLSVHAGPDATDRLRR